MVVFENMSGECRDLFIDGTAEYIEFLEEKGYEYKTFIERKKSNNPNFDSKFYSSQMPKTLERQTKLLKILQDRESIPDVFDLALGEGIAGAIIRKMIKLKEPAYAEMQTELKLKILKYQETFKKYFPDDEAPTTLDDFIKRHERYRGRVDSRL